MLSIKSESNQSQNSFDRWTNLMRGISVQPNSILRDFYQAKKLVSKLRLKKEKIDCCLKGCMLYYKDDATFTYYKFYENLGLSPSEEWEV